MENNTDACPQVNLNGEMNIINDNLNINNENCNKSKITENQNINRTENKEISNEFFEEEEQEGVNIIYKDSERKQIKLLSLDLLLKKIVIENFIEDNPLIIYCFCQQCFSFFDKQILFKKIINCYKYYHNKGTEFKQLSSIVKFFNILVIEMLDYYTFIKKDDPILKIINYFYEGIKNDLDETKKINNTNSKNCENNLNVKIENTEKINTCSNNNENNNSDYCDNKTIRTTINIDNVVQKNKINFNDNKQNENNKKNYKEEIQENLELSKNIDIFSSYNDILYNTKEILDKSNISNRTLNNINFLHDNFDDSQNISYLTNVNNISKLSVENINIENSINDSEADELEKSKTQCDFLNNNDIKKINDNEENLSINNITNKTNEIKNNYPKDENDTENNLKIDDISNDNNKLTKKKKIILLDFQK